MTRDTLYRLLLGLLVVTLFACPSRVFAQADDEPRLGDKAPTPATPAAATDIIRLITTMREKSDALFPTKMIETIQGPIPEFRAHPIGINKPDADLVLLGLKLLASGDSRKPAMACNNAALLLGSLGIDAAISIPDLIEVFPYGFQGQSSSWTFIKGDAADFPTAVRRWEDGNTMILFLSNVVDSELLKSGKNAGSDPWKPFVVDSTFSFSSYIRKDPTGAVDLAEFTSYAFRTFYTGAFALGSITGETRDTQQQWLEWWRTNQEKYIYDVLRQRLNCDVRSTAGEDQLRMLRDALGNKNSELRWTVLLLLGAKKDTKAIPLLVEVLEKGTDFERLNAAYALGEIGGDSALSALRAAKTGSSPYLAREVKNALNKISNGNLPKPAPAP